MALVRRMTLMRRITLVRRIPLVPGRLLGVIGNPWNAMRRPMQQAAQRLFVCHLGPPSLSLIEAP